MDEQIKAFLESREWLQKKVRDYETPRDDLNNYVTISKESYATYDSAKVKIQINQNAFHPGYSDVMIWFMFIRATDEYELIFRGFVSGVDDLIKAFELVGVDKKYLDYKK